MRALLIEQGRLRFEHNAPNPVLASDQALIHLRCAGICNTDLELLRGYKNFSGIPGHEFVGEVDGRRVVGEINVACGECDFCARGIPSQCRTRSAVGIFNHAGAFADQLALKTLNLHPVPNNIPDHVAVFAEPLAAALQVLEQVHLTPGMRVVVLGIGKLGALCAQVAHLTGAEVIGVVRREKQAKLLAGWGIRAAHIDELSKQRAQVVIDCTGTAEGFAAALDLIEPRGTLVLKSTYTGTPHADLTLIAVNEIRIIGSRCGPFEPALRLLSEGRIEVESLIEARYPFAQATAAFERADQPGALKILLDWN